MKILVFSWRDPKHPLSGGAEQVMHEHMKGWIKEGHNVTLFSSRFPNSSAEEGIDGVHIVRQGYQYLGVQFAGFLYYMKNKKKYDLIIDQFHGLPFFTPFYVRKPKLAVIQETAREVWFLNPLPRPINWVVGIIGYLAEPLIFLFYKKISFMTGSASCQQDLLKLGIPKVNITIIHHGVLIKNPTPFPRKEKVKTIIYLGVLSKDKGIEDALLCFSQLSKEANFQFWVVGKPETKGYGGRIKKMAKDSGLYNRVKFWGFVSQEKKFELLARAHVLINPSIREGWGLVNIEANSMGTPVVAYRGPGLVDSVNDGLSGILCLRSAVRELAVMIRDLLNDDKRYQELQNGALIWSKNFSWNESVNQSLSLIEKVKK